MMTSYQKQFAKQVKEQIEIERTITKHTVDYTKPLLVGLMCGFAGLFSLAPIDGMQDIEFGMLILYFVFLGFGIDVYNGTHLLIVENGKRVNIFTKYRNVPIDVKVLVWTKNIMLGKICLICLLTNQGINLLVRLIVFSVSGTGRINIFTFYPIWIIVMIFIVESIQIRVYARKM